MPLLRATTFGALEVNVTPSMGHSFIDNNDVYGSHLGV